MITFLVLAFYFIVCIAAGIAIATVDDTNDGGSSAEASRKAKEDAR